MRPLALLVVLIPLTGLAQSKGRRTMLTGTVVTVPSGDRLAIGTRLGIFSVDARAAKIGAAGKAGKFSDLRLGSSVTVLGTVSPGAPGGRPLVIATRIDVAPELVATPKRPRASKGT